MSKRARLRVHRKSFMRGTHMTRVPKSVFYIKDIGEAGRSEEPYAGASHLQKGRMSAEIAGVLGYEKAPTHLTATEWRKVFVLSTIPTKSWRGMLMTQVARRKFADASSDGRYSDKLAFRRAGKILTDVRASR